MYLKVLNAETKEELDKCQVDEWFDGVRYVEENKKTYLEKNINKVIIINKRAKTKCFWELVETEEPRFLNDQVHESCRSKK